MMVEPSEAGQDTHWNLGGPKAYSEADIDSAITAGILPAETAARLKRHVLEAAASPGTDEEHFRLVGGFNDIFVSIASVLLLIAMARLIPHESIAAVSVAATAWGLAEYFVRKKRLALTAIVLLVSFAAGIFLSIVRLAPLYTLHEYERLLAACSATAVASWLHWRRFHVPISVACGTGASLGLLFTLLLTVFPSIKNHVPPILFCSGIIVLGLAMHWDSSDTARQTRRSDVAFWLHLLAAPLLVHPIFSRLGVFSGQTTTHLAWFMVGLYVVIGLISLIIDRRALMVSSLAYVLYAFSIVFKEYGIVKEELAVAALVIGVALLLLAALWQPARAGVMAILPREIQRRLPPARTR